MLSYARARACLPARRLTDRLLALAGTIVIVSFVGCQSDRGLTRPDPTKETTSAFSERSSSSEDVQESELFYFLPPVGPDHSETGGFDSSLLPALTVEICQLAGQQCGSEGVTRLTAETGPPDGLRIDDNDAYVALWRTPRSEAETGSYRITVTLLGFALGHRDVYVGKDGIDPGSHLPIRFRTVDGLATTSVVGPSGGSLYLSALGIHLTVPAGAVSSSIPIGIVRNAYAPLPSTTLGEEVVPPFDLLPNGTVFAKPALLSVASPNLAASLLRRSSDGQYLVLIPTTVDEATGSISAPLKHFSTYYVPWIPPLFPGNRTFVVRGIPDVLKDAPEEAREDVRRAFKMWQSPLSAAGIHFEELPPGSSGTADVEIGTEPSSELYGDDGITLFPLFGSDRIIVINGADSYWRTVSAGARDIEEGGAGAYLYYENTVAHELGHAIGLNSHLNQKWCKEHYFSGRECEAPPLMRPIMPFAQVPYALSCEDLNYLYKLAWEGHPEYLSISDTHCASAVVAVGPIESDVAAGADVVPAPAVYVTDGYGRPVSGVPVVFHADPSYTGGATLVGRATETDEGGIARLAQWTVGSVPGDYAVVGQVSTTPEESETVHTIHFVAHASGSSNGGSFNFAVDHLEVYGNIPAGTFVDDFGDGRLDVPPTSEFECHSPVTESDGVLHLSSADGAEAYGGGFVDNCVLGETSASTRFSDGAGSSAITATFRPDLPVTYKSYGIQLVAANGTLEPSAAESGERLLLTVAYDEYADVVFVQLEYSPEPGSGFVSSVRVTNAGYDAHLAGVPNVKLRLVLDDTYNSVSASFSLDDGATYIGIPTGAYTAKIFTSSPDALLSVFGYDLSPS